MTPRQTEPAMPSRISASTYLHAAPIPTLTCHPLDNGKYTVSHYASNGPSFTIVGTAQEIREYLSAVAITLDDRITRQRTELGDV